MSYASGGLIQAADYNGLVGGGNQINYIWSTGYGNLGYGQTAIANVSVGGTVTATQWASLINTLNNIRNHQSGAGTGTITAPTAGDTVTYLSTVSTSITTAFNNASLFATNGSTTTGSTFNPTFSQAGSAGAFTWQFSRTITFASGDAARYFFNSGGKINFVTISAVANDAGGRSTDWVTLLGTNLGSISNIGQVTNNGRSGSAGTLNTNNTNLGYRNSTTSAQDIVKVTSTTYPYNADYVNVAVRTSTQNSSGNGDKGATVYLDFTVYSGPLVDALGVKTINVTWNHRIDLVNPETTYLSTSPWGTPTIT